MWNRLAFSVCLASVVFGCAARPSPRTSPAPIAAAPRIEQATYTIWISAATIEPRRPDGSAWHVRPADNATVAVGATVGLAVGNPELGMKVGAALADPGGDPEAPVAYVNVKLAGHTWTVAPVHRSYSPTWNQPIDVNARGMTGEEQVIIQVLDAVDDSLLAYTETSLASLLSAPAQTLTRLTGSVVSVDIRVELDRASSLERVDANALGD